MKPDNKHIPQDVIFEHLMLPISASTAAVNYLSTCLHVMVRKLDGWKGSGELVELLS